MSTVHKSFLIRRLCWLTSGQSISPTDPLATGELLQLHPPILKCCCFLIAMLNMPLHLDTRQVQSWISASCPFTEKKGAQQPPSCFLIFLDLREIVCRKGERNPRRQCQLALLLQSPAIGKCRYRCQSKYPAFAGFFIGPFCHSDAICCRLIQ